jgi:hypothetical protein
VEDLRGDDLVDANVEVPLVQGDQLNWLALQRFSQRQLVGVDQVVSLPLVVIVGQLGYREVEVGDSAVHSLVAAALDVNDCPCVIAGLDVDYPLLADHAGAPAVVGQNLTLSKTTLRSNCTVLVAPR